MTVLLDTNVLRELWHSQGNPKVRAAVEKLPQESAFLSVISIGEMSKGIELMGVGVKRNQIKAWLHQTEVSFAERVLPVISPVAHLWGKITALAKSRGIIVPASDGLIAATALHHGLAVMTRNTRDFAATGVTVIDPWSME